MWNGMFCSDWPHTVFKFNGTHSAVNAQNIMPTAGGGKLNQSRTGQNDLGKPRKKTLMPISQCLRGGMRCGTELKLKIWGFRKKQIIGEKSKND